LLTEILQKLLRGITQTLQGIQQSQRRTLQLQQNLHQALHSKSHQIASNCIKTHKNTSNQRKQHLTETMASSTKDLKKKPTNKLAKPVTRSSSKQFESDTTEVKTLARAPERHLE
jgi:hypothetical protein